MSKKLPTLKNVLKEADALSRPRWAGGGKQGWGMADPAPQHVRPQPSRPGALNGEELMAVSNVLADILGRDINPSLPLRGSDMRAVEELQDLISKTLGITADKDADPRATLDLDTLDGEEKAMLSRLMQDPLVFKNQKPEDQMLIKKIAKKVFDERAAL